MFLEALAIVSGFEGVERISEIAAVDGYPDEPETHYRKSGYFHRVRIYLV
jgi:hypothetical protein